MGQQDTAVLYRNNGLEECRAVKPSSLAERLARLCGLGGYAKPVVRRLFLPRSVDLRDTDLN